MGDLLDLDAVDQALAVEAGDVSPEELVEASRQRIVDRDGDIAAVVHVGSASRPRADLAAGPFRGVPILVKDLWCEVAGDPSWDGMQVLRQARHQASRDGATARRLRQAGFVIVGRTNTSELGLSVATEPHGRPPTRNPWDLSRSPGGSSGGSAAAVAAGMVAVAHGSDMAGSLRIPAAWCGVVGFKPSRGRSPVPAQLSPDARLLAQEHVLTRTVRDTAATFEATSHGAGASRWSAVSNWGQVHGTRRDGPARRVGLVTELAGVVSADPHVAAAVRRAGHLLEECGHHVEVAHPPALEDQRLWDFQLAMASAHAESELRRVQTLLGRPITQVDVEPSTWALATHAASLTDDELHARRSDAHEWARWCRSWWRAEAPHADRDEADAFDLLVTPTVTHTAPRLGAVDEFEATRFTFPFNLTGQPALSLPVPTDGLPVGVQLVAAPQQDDLVLRTAMLLERSWR